MTNTLSQGSPLNPLDMELYRTIKQNKIIANEGVHDQGALLDGIVNEPMILNH